MVTAAWSYDIRRAAEAASDAGNLLAAFCLTIIILVMTSSELRKDPLSTFVVRPFLLAFLGNLVSAFQFMMVLSDTTLSARTFALAIPPEVMMVISAALMLFGISIVIQRHFTEPRVVRLTLYVFLIAGLYTIGVVVRGLADLSHVNAGIALNDKALGTQMFLLGTVPGLLWVGYRWVRAYRSLPLEALLDRLMRNTCVAFVASTLLFGVAMQMNPGDRVPQALLPVLALAVTMMQWLVVAVCFCILTRFPALCLERPLAATAMPPPSPL